MTPPTRGTQPPAPAPGDGWARRTQLEPSPGLVFGGFWIRLVAFLIDASLIGIVEALVYTNLGISMAGVYVISSIVPIVYFIGFWSTTGQTIGMMPFRLRVVRNSDGGRLGFGGALLRLVGLAIGCLPLYVGVIWVAFDSRKRGWHDHFASSVVIRRTRCGRTRQAPDVLFLYPMSVRRMVRDQRGAGDRRCSQPWARRVSHIPRVQGASH